MDLHFVSGLTKRFERAQKLLTEIPLAPSGMGVAVHTTTHNRLVELLGGGINYLDFSLGRDSRRLGVLFGLSPFFHSHGFYLLPSGVELTSSLMVYEPTSHRQLPMLLQVFFNGSSLETFHRQVIFRDRREHRVYGEIVEIQYHAPSLVYSEPASAHLEPPAPTLLIPVPSLEPVSVSLAPTPSFVLSAELTRLVDTRLRDFIRGDKLRIGPMEAGGIIFVGDFLKAPPKARDRMWQVGRKTWRGVNCRIRESLPTDYQEIYLALWRRPTERMNQEELRPWLDRPMGLRDIVVGRKDIHRMVQESGIELRYVGDVVQLTEASFSKLTESSGKKRRLCHSHIFSAVAEALYNVHPFLTPQMKIPWWSRPA